ncbi:MAG: hypothetical protein IEMM0008_0403 [bacterium]|nr:MAG: hypothetical protein IEMM0008_0403 [bacterium]
MSSPKNPVAANLVLSAAMLVIMLVLVLMGVRSFGIHPRTGAGLFGIFISPFLHANMSHFYNNAAVLIILLPTISLFNGKRAKIEMLVIIVVGGLGVWFIGGSNTNHIGASGLVFGLITLLFLGGIIKRDVKSVLASIAVFFAYSLVVVRIFPTNLSEIWFVLQQIGGNFFKGLNPGQTGISWEGHLFGAIGGVIAAFMFRKKVST